MNVNVAARQAFEDFKAMMSLHQSPRDVRVWNELEDFEKEAWKNVVRNTIAHVLPRLKDDREIKTVRACIDYAKDPYGDVAHNLKVLLAKYANALVIEDN